MEACNVPNVGAKPEGNTVQERYWAEQEEQLIHALRMKQMAEELGIPPELLGQHPTGKGSTTGKGGRPPSGQASPQ
jgi:hypothetical protein